MVDMTYFLASLAGFSFAIFFGGWLLGYEEAKNKYFKASKAERRNSYEV